VILSVRTEDHRLDLERRYGVAVTLDNRALAAQADIIILAVKPKAIVEILNSIGDALVPGTLLISTAAGVPLEVIESRVPGFVAVIRTMPNLAVSVGEGMTALSRGKNVSQKQVEIAMGALRRCRRRSPA
jgi:pyrroline-5-carboxylate reductase